LGVCDLSLGFGVLCLAMQYSFSSMFVFIWGWGSRAASAPPPPPPSPHATHNLTGGGGGQGRTFRKHRGSGGKHWQCSNQQRHQQYSCISIAAFAAAVFPSKQLRFRVSGLGFQVLDSRVSRLILLSRMPEMRRVTDRCEPSSPNPKPQTPNPKPQTPNPKPQPANLPPQTAIFKPQTTACKPQPSPLRFHSGMSVASASFLSRQKSAMLREIELGGLRVTCDM